MKTSKIIFWVSVSVIVSLGIKYLAQYEKNEEPKKTKAIELVQNYKVSDDLKLIDGVNFAIEISKATGQIIEIHGWDAEKVSDKVYKVTFSFLEVTVEKYTQCAVDIESGNVNPLDEFAANVMLVDLE